MGAADPITNEQAVRTLYAEHREWLQDWLRRRLGSVDDAADLSQDTFVRVLTFSDARTIDEPKAYLATLAKRLLSSFWRRRALEASWLEVLARQPLAVAPSAEDEALLREAIESIDRMLDGLPLRCRQAFLLNRLEGMTHTAIAAHLGVSLATVERDVRRAYLHCLVADPAAG
ncbi:MAG: sigma-70 family RNA polymerase sigma factor [Burkholderiaceae bacterium]